MYSYALRMPVGSKRRGSAGGSGKVLPEDDVVIVRMTVPVFGRRTIAIWLPGCGPAVLEDTCHTEDVQIPVS